MLSVEVKEYTLSQYNQKEILRYCGIKSADEGFSAILQACQEEANEVVSARVCYALLPVRVENTICDFGVFFLSSKHLAKALQGCKRAVIFVATVGVAMDRLIAKYGKISPVKALCMQAIGSERAEAVADEFCKELKEQFTDTRPRFSPGYGDLSLETQGKIFDLLNPAKNIGVSLTDNLLMTPSKSISAFVGIVE